MFTHDNRFTVTRDCDLVIARLGAEDGGGYECQVVDRRSGSITQVLVELQVVPSKYQDHPLQRDDPNMIAGTIRAHSTHSNNVPFPLRVFAPAHKFFVAVIAKKHQS